jgi:hypothetical protein
VLKQLPRHHPEGPSAEIDVRTSIPVELDEMGIFLLLLAILWWAFTERWPAWTPA